MKYQFILYSNSGVEIDRSDVHDTHTDGMDYGAQSLATMRLNLAIFRGQHHSKFKNCRVELGTYRNGLLDDNTIDMVA